MPFLLVTCHVGAEPTLRAALSEQGLRPAFARPGVLTLKTDTEVDPSVARPHPLVRTWGASLGRASTADEVRDALVGLPWGAALHVFPGEAGPPGKVPPKLLAAWVEEARRVEDLLVAALGDRVSPGAAQLGDHVVQVIVRPGEPWLLSHHVHDLARGPLPGGQWPLSPPGDAPSRAWAKLEELMCWSRSWPKDGDRVLEVGCAPGGATVALLDRGARVCGIDPVPVRLPDRLANAPFIQIQRPIEGVPRADLPDDVKWIVVDISVSAPVALHNLQRLVPPWRSSLKGVFITLKLTEWELADRLPELLERLRDMGFEKVDAASLPSFRQEVGVWATGLPRG